jgi:translocation and assembly module TamA
VHIPHIPHIPRISCPLLALALGCLCSLPLAAAPQLIAPEPVRGLLSSHLSLDGAEAAALDSTQRALLEHRLRKEAGELLATEGYFSPQLELRDAADGLVIAIETGPQAHIGRVDIEFRGALGETRRQQLIEKWSLPADAAFRQASWDSAKNALLRDLLAVDHASARLLSSSAEVDAANARVDLTLVYDAGPRYRYGELQILGLERYPPSLVERYRSRLKTGEAYRQEDLLAVQTALQNTPYFSSVTVELENEAMLAAANAEASPAQEKPVTVPVLIRLREKAPFNVALGAGYSSNTGARVEGNFRNADFMGKAWELNTGARLEQLRQTAYADIFLPPELQKRQRDSVGGLVEKSDIQGLGLQRVALAGARVQTRGSIEQRLGVNWQYEQQNPDGVHSSVNRALTASAGWVWRHAADANDASQGTVAQLQLGGASKALLSEQSFVRSYFRYSQGIALGKSDGLLLRGEAGVTAAASRQGIPQDSLFRAGGSNSVRGYAYQSLGVKEGNATVGGRYLLTLSAEYTHWLDAQWGVASFVDAGQAADDFKDFKLAMGYGMGARWKSPAGPLAIDLAWGQRDQQVRMHFSLAIPF